MQPRRSRTLRPSPVNTAGATVWLTGLPSAGKTTIACELAGRLRGGG
ncbi:adenylyl-sulfate kinase, partial [Streptomyces sp. NPDC059070]